MKISFKIIFGSIIALLLTVGFSQLHDKDESICTKEQPVTIIATIDNGRTRSGAITRANGKVTPDIGNDVWKPLEVTPDATNDKATGRVQMLLKNTDTAQYKFVMLANLPEITPDASTFTNMSYDEVMEQFTYDMPTDGNWKNGELPMWGEVTAVIDHNQGANPKISETVKLIRAVARIDVGLNITMNGSTQFNETANGITGITMTSLKFYNMNDKGTVVPKGALDQTEPAKPKVNTPAVPASAQIGKIYDMQSTIVDGKLVLRSVYVPEAFNKPTKASAGANGETLPDNPDNYLKRPYLVVGLKGADKSNPDRETFFRIDYLKRTGTEADAKYKYLPLLRNYHYLVNITNVGGPGFDSLDEAKKGPAANIMYNVEEWEESSMSNVQYDGKYMLGVSEDSLTYYNRKSTQSINIRTSWPKGLKATVTEGADWIGLNPTTAATEGTKEVTSDIVDKDVPLKIFVKDNLSNTATERNGVITITAGRMSWKVKVKQLTKGDLSIKIYAASGVTPINMLVFSGEGETKRIVVEYSPSDGTYTGSQNVADFIFTEISNVNGRVTYDVTSKPMTDVDDEFETKQDMVNFQVSDKGEQAGQALILIQTEYNAIPYEILNDKRQFRIDEDRIPLFLLDGTKKYFVIKANTRYELKMISHTAAGLGDSNPNNLKLIEKGFTLNTAVEKKGVFDGEKITFTPYNDFTDGYKRSYGFAEFELSSPDNLFKPRRFKIMLASGKKQPEANCYMVKPNHVGILIPVSRINTAKKFYDQNSDQFFNWDAQYALHGLDPDEAWSPKLEWSDMESIGTKPINSDGTAGLRFVKRVRESQGQSKYIYVLPGKDTSKVGNTLIACHRRIDEKIIWSWHLWVVDKYPELKVKWQDRNIGANKVAVSDTDDNKATFGMQYHFGRKDPIPLFAHRGSAGDNNSYGVLVDDSGKKFTLYNPGPLNRVRLSMRESIEQPSRVVWDWYNWMTESENDKRLWYNLWGGVKENEDSDRAWSLNLKTDKTVFDPCPYGWKVPALGKESDYRAAINSGELVLPRTGKSHVGNLDIYDENLTYYGLSTVYSNTTWEGARTIYYDRNRGASISNKHSRTMGRVIRCVKNEGYDDAGQTKGNEFKDYTDFLPNK